MLRQASPLLYIGIIAFLSRNSYSDLHGDVRQKKEPKSQIKKIHSVSRYKIWLKLKQSRETGFSVVTARYLQMWKSFFSPFFLLIKSKDDFYLIYTSVIRCYIMWLHIYLGLFLACCLPTCSSLLLWSNFLSSCCSLFW